MVRSCLVVGAGIAGLTAARTLSSAGWQVTVVDKGRGVGGRMATRRVGESRFDHGAQFFTARDPRFAAWVTEWESAGVASAWFTNEEGQVQYCGVGGMTSVPKYLARGLDVRTRAEIVDIESVDGCWQARDENGTMYQADVLLLTAPVEQSLALCEPFRVLLGRRLVQSLQSIHFDPCYSLMVLTDGPSAVLPPGIERPEHSVVLSIADNTKKGITRGGAALTIHATARFTIEHWDESPAIIAAAMMRAASSWITAPVTTWELHRWRYSHPARTGDTSFLNARCPSPVYFAGDGFGGPRVEGAFLSGLEAAEHIVASHEQSDA